MPRNEGIRPPNARVDIKYRCGVIVRDIDPGKRRWTLNDPAFLEDFDIVWWQPVGTGRG